jgi:hypothetical protein
MQNQRQIAAPTPQLSRVPYYAKIGTSGAAKICGGAKKSASCELHIRRLKESICAACWHRVCFLVECSENNVPLDKGGSLRLVP